jgi:tetratricopeptide (TPR) repeat protein
MGFIEKWRRKKSVKNAVTLVKEGKVDEGFDLVSKNAKSDEAVSWSTFAEYLIEEEFWDEARRAVEKALQCEPEDWYTNVLNADILIHDDNKDEAIEIYRKLLARRPDHKGVARLLVELLQEQEDYKAIVGLLDKDEFSTADDQWILFSLGRSYFVLGDNEKAFTYLDRAVDALENCMKNSMSHVEWNEYKKDYDEVRVLLDEVIASAHGREELIVTSAEKKHLDGAAGVNYKLLGERLMLDSPRIAKDLWLKSVKEMNSKAKELIRKDKNDIYGTILTATALMREGHASKARNWFERASEGDNKNFAALLGLGAAMDAVKYDYQRKIKRLPDLPCPDGIENIIPDFPSLTDLERKVVVASIYPLRGSISRLAEHKCVVRILPIDVRAVDLGIFKELDGIRDDDHRSYTAATGLAEKQTAIVKVEDLFDIDGDNGFVFAHEFAHVFFFQYKELIGEAVSNLQQKALDVGYVAGVYQMKNIYEFFAVSYTDYLLMHYDLNLQKEMDEEGVLESVFDFFKKLSECDDLESLTLNS